MKRYFLLITLLTLSACATVTAEREQLIEVNTVPQGAACSLSNSQGSYTIAATPGTAVVQRMYEPLSVSCGLNGAGSASMLIEAKTRGRAYGNILLLGVPAIVDAHTGAGYEYDPSSITLTLQ